MISFCMFLITVCAIALTLMTGAVANPFGSVTFYFSNSNCTGPVLNATLLYGTNSDQQWSSLPSSQVTTSPSRSGLQCLSNPIPGVTSGQYQCANSQSMTTVYVNQWTSLSGCPSNYTQQLFQFSGLQGGCLNGGVSSRVLNPSTGNYTTSTSRVMAQITCNGAADHGLPILLVLVLGVFATLGL
jgi:hypothetical protein